MVKKFYSASNLFIGVRGGRFKKRLDSTVAIFRVARVHSDVPRVTFFTRIRDLFVESDHRSQPASPRG
jgi:hypothetical protein